ncbi:MATE family efflux transporter [Oceanospirillum sediminis]|uniref:Multidrug-efflux transporter n=1 Tax=Oceanospirillum sediminis TaxID=2760088 RepID=A0A839INK8_9GAMM|nr:MATE family efflux transporter [Oceanospirillum sediminis]MBB1486057.1 MATE family efflux transporter [Oceanospirillum sediminis]
MSSSFLPDNTENGTDFRTEVYKLLIIALPIMGAQLAQSGMAVADTLMTGRLGADALAAVALGASIWTPLFLFMAGVMLGLTPFVAQWQGENKPEKTGPFTFQGFWLGLAMSLISIILISFHTYVLDLMSAPVHLYDLVSDYLLGIMLAFPAIGLYQTMRSYTEGLGLTKPVLIISVIALLINILANAVLIFGWGPIPALGVLGCGIATAIAVWSSVIMMWLNIRYRSRYQQTTPFQHFSLPEPRILNTILQTGLPIGVAIFFEVGLFTTIALFIAHLGTTQVAAHQIALNVTSVTFMIPLSLAMALTVRVGHSLGEQKRKHTDDTAPEAVYVSRRITRFVAITGIICTVIASGFTASIMFFLPESIARLYTADTEVIALAVTLLHLAAVFQLSDALQVSASGALRGYKDTKIIMPITLVSYWVIGMGLGYVLALTDIIVPAQGVSGFWYGLIAGLSCAAILLCWRLRKTAS